MSVSPVQEEMPALSAEYKTPLSIEVFLFYLKRSMNNIDGLVILLTYLAVTTSAVSSALEARRHEIVDRHFHSSWTENSGGSISTYASAPVNKKRTGYENNQS